MSGGLTRGCGLTEDVRHLWALSVGYTADVHDTMKRVPGINLGLKDQNIEIRAATMSRDYDYCHRFYQWLEVQNPFNIEDVHLHSLSTGIVSVAGKDPVECEIAEIIGVRIQENLDNHPFNEAKIKRKEKLIILDYC